MALSYPRPQAQQWTQLDRPTQIVGERKLLAFLKAPFQTLLAKKVGQAFVQNSVMRCTSDLIYLGEEYETLTSSAGLRVLRDSTGGENLL